MDHVRIYFIVPENCTDYNQVSDIMMQAFEACKQNNVNVEWVHESKFDPASVVKTDFVVFQDFEGDCFEKLKDTKSASIVGPWCVLICLIEGKPIPNFTWPIYNVAMQGCVVTCSHLSKAEKNTVKEKVQLMGGCYTDKLMSTTTHLVTESVKSEKYLHAAESNAKLMISQWVKSVWEASQSKNIHCDNDEFMKYRCLPFHNLTICATGVETSEVRDKLSQSVAKNGGIFTGTLSLSKTDVLVVYGERGTLSQKYKAARVHQNIFCVTIEWIYDSIEKGYALDHSLYAVKKVTSTPTKGDEPMPDFSMISAIGESTSQRIATLEATVFSSTINRQSTALGERISPNKRKCTDNDGLEQLIQGLDIKKAKRAGQYLDGCSVYIAGFKPEHREKICKILNLSGATRYDDISDRLTHVIVGDPSCPEVKLIKAKNYSISLVSIQWLRESLEKQQVAEEENHLIKLFDAGIEQFSSPLGRKGLSLLRSNKTLTSSDVEAAHQSQIEAPANEQDLMQQYRKTLSKNEETDTLMQLLNADSKFNSRPDVGDDQAGTTTDDESLSQQSALQDRSSQPVQIFYSKKFLFTDNFNDEVEYLKEQIQSVFGTIMPKTYKGIPDYVVAPMFIYAPIQMSALEIVNNLWVIESIQEEQEVAIAYYHRPLVVSSGDKPLKECVVTISGYTAYERQFLKGLIEQLGGLCQEQFARVNNREKNVTASTHLISLEASGKKFEAALKWGLPVLNKDWLLECATLGRYALEEQFLVGAAKSSYRSVEYSDGSATSTTGPRGESGSKTPRVDGSVATTPGRRAGRESASKNKRAPTPLNERQHANVDNPKTPVNQRLFKGSTETPFSQVTPVNKLMEEVRRTNLLGTPQTPPMPKSWYSIDTPESPFGAFIQPHMSPKSKKELMRYINCIPDFVPPREVPKSTPLSVVKRRAWARLLGTDESPTTFAGDRAAPSVSNVAELKGQGVGGENQENEPGQMRENPQEEPEPSQTSVSQNLFTHKLKQIESMVNAFGETRRGSSLFQNSSVPDARTPTLNKDSQPFTVGWDYNDEVPKSDNQGQVKMFMLSGIENEAREVIVAKIESLGGHVSSLKSYDPKSTHLLCTKPARNEKALACMASGKWILHSSYIDKSVEAGKFLNEENFEFGNPKAKHNIGSNFDKETEARFQAMHYWRTEISRRGYGAFNDMRAIVVASKKEPLVRVIEAGGGHIVDVVPPFTEYVHATHCLMEARSVTDMNLYNPLAQQGILCLNTLYISDFLYRTNDDIKDAMIPHYSRFF